MDGNKTREQNDEGILIYTRRDKFPWLVSIFERRPPRDALASTAVACYGGTVDSLHDGYRASEAFPGEDVCRCISYAGLEGAGNRVIR